MKNLANLFLSISLLLCVNLFADIDEVSNLGPGIENLLPQSIVNGSVDALSGSYHDSELDLYVEGMDPLSFQRNYRFGRREYKGPYIFEDFGVGTYLSHPYCVGGYQQRGMMDKNGSFYLFDRIHNPKAKPGDKVHYKISDYYGRGYTNLSQEYFGGQTHLKNFKLVAQPLPGKQERYELRMPDGSCRSYFTPKYRDLGQRFYLETESLPSGRQLRYHYSPDWKLKRISLHCPVAKKVMSWIKLSYQNDKVSRLEASDGKEVCYEYSHDKQIDLAFHGDLTPLRTYRPWPFITRVRPSHKPPINYHLNPDKLIIEKKLASGAAIKTHFLNWGKEKILSGQDIHVLLDKGYIDRRYRKVKAQYAPVGPNGEMEKIASFHYLGEEKNKRFHSSSQTKVYDAYGHLTLYKGSKEGRIQEIITHQKFGDKQKQIKKDCYFWGAKGSFEEGDLIAVAHLDENNQVLSGSYFVYDQRHNVKEKVFYGNLTGNCRGSIKLDHKGIPLNSQGMKAYDLVRQHYRYNEQDLLIYKKQGDVITTLSYYPGTRRVKGIWVSEGKNTLKRHFYFYDATGFLTKKIEDDGYKEACQDYSGVHYRKVEEYTPCHSEHHGKPREIKEFYYDTNKQQKQLKKLSVLSYDKEGREVQCLVYGDLEKKQLLYSSRKQYNDYGQVIREEKPCGQVFIKQYNRAGQLLKEKQGLKEKRYVYDKVGRLFRVEDVSLSHDHQALPKIFIQYVYDKCGRVVEEKDQNGCSKYYQYNVLSLPIKQSSSPIFNGQKDSINTLSRRYDSQGNIVELQEGVNPSQRFSYSAYAKPTYHQFEDGRQESWSYYCDGRLHSHMNAEGIKTVYHYDALERITLIQTYNDQNIKVKEVKNVYKGFYLDHTLLADGSCIRYEYDAFGRKIKEEHAGKKTTFYYDAFDRLLSKKVFISSEDYIQECFQYDALGRLIKEEKKDSQQQLQRKVEKDYDDLSLVTRERRYTHLDKFSEYHTFHNGRGEVELMKDPLGNKTINNTLYPQQTGKKGRVVKKIVDPMGRELIQEYNALQQLLVQQLLTPSGKVIKMTQYSYHPSGLLARQEEKNLSKGYSHISYFEYDKGGRVVAMREEGKRPRRFFYDAKGRLVKTLLPSQREIHFCYDALSRLMKRYAGDHSYEYYYNIHDRVVRVKEKKGTSYKDSHCSLDTFGRVCEEHFSNGLSIKYSYDSMDRIIGIEMPKEGALYYHYQGLNLANIERINKQKPQYCVDFNHYDLQGRPLNMRCGKLQQAFTWDEMGRRVALVSDAYIERAKAFDACGNLLSLSQDASLRSFEYDEASRLSKENWEDIEQQFCYDSLGNRMEKCGSQVQVDKHNQLQSDASYKYSYDEDGNLIEKKGEGLHLLFSYNPFGLLESIEEKGSKKLFLSYDYQDRLMTLKSLLIDPSSEHETWSEKDYLYLRDLEIGRVEKGELKAFRTITPKGLGEIGATRVVEQGKSYYLAYNDYVGSIKVLKNLDNYEKTHYHYSSFGELLTKEGVAESPWTFLGKQELLMSYFFFGKRLYDAASGCFITRDPNGLSEGTHPYHYADNRPYYYTDPQGFSKKGQARDGDFSQSYGLGSQPHVVMQGVNQAGVVSNLEKVMGQDPDKGVPVYSLEAFHNHERLNLVFVNGIGTSRASAKSTSELIVNQAPPYSSITTIYNYNTGSIVLDTIKCCFEKLGVKTRPSRELERYCKDYFSQAGDNERLTVIAYSGGNIVSKLAFEGLSKDIRERIDYLGIAPGAYINHSILPHSTFVVGSDVVPLLSGVWGNHQNVRFYTSEKQGPTRFWSWLWSGEQSLANRVMSEGNQHAIDSPIYASQVNIFLNKLDKASRDDDYLKVDINLITRGY